MNVEYKLRAIFFSILFLIAGGIILFFYHYKKTHTVPENIYVEDYPEIYAEELRIIFGEDCEIGEKKTFYEEGTFQELTEITHCSVSIGVGGYGYTLDIEEEYDRIEAGNQKYKEQLLAAYRDTDTMLRLSELDYEEIYEHYPMKVSFFLSIDDPELSGEEKAVHEKAVQDRVLEMIQAIQRETDDTCNLIVQVDSANGHGDMYDGARDWRYYILQGKQFEPEGEPNISYSFAHAYVYEGIYW